MSGVTAVGLSHLSNVGVTCGLGLYTWSRPGRQSSGRCRAGRVLAALAVETGLSVAQRAAANVQRATFTSSKLFILVSPS